MRRHHWKERPEISKMAKFENDTCLASKGITPLIKLRKFTDVGEIVGASLCPRHTNVSKISRPWGAAYIFISFQQITSQLGNSTNFKAIFSVVSTDFSIFTIICRNRRLRQIIDQLATDKSRYFAITVLTNCFIIRSPSLFFNEYRREAKRFSFFYARAFARRRKAWFRLHMSRIVFARKQLDDIPHEQTTICRQLFTGHVVDFRPMKREKVCIKWKFF